MKKVAAIIAAYNEGERISGVLTQLLKSKLIGEIIVVDDGSTDQTGKVVNTFPVKYIKLPKNRGKAAALDYGIKSTDADILFLCDADLKDLNVKDAEAVIKPVITGETGMAISKLSNLILPKWTYSSHLSGQRALRREIWENLPDFYKKKFRIETGLNEYAKHYENGYLCINKSHAHTNKFLKFGFWEGLYKMASMYTDVLLAYLRFKIMDVPEQSRLLRTQIAKSTLSALFAGLSGIFFVLGSSAGYRTIMNFFWKALWHNPDASPLIWCIKFLTHYTLHTFMIAGVIIASLGIMLLGHNLFGLVVLLKNRKTTNRTI